jgi:hypothetical protein
MADDIPFSYPLRGARLDSSDEAKAELEILRRLAAGKNPLTEALLPDDSCYQSAKVLRALLAAIKALEKAPRIRKLPAKQANHGPLRKMRTSENALMRD